MSIFFILCAAIGVLQVAENFKLISQKGEQLILDQLFSAFELVWLFVSLWFLFQDGLSIVGMVAIGIFAGYHVLGWLVGYQAYKASKESDSGTILIHTWYLKVNMAICLAYTGVSYLAYFQLRA